MSPNKHISSPPLCSFALNDAAICQMSKVRIRAPALISFPKFSRLENPSVLHSNHLPDPIPFLFLCIFFQTPLSLTCFLPAAYDPSPHCRRVGPRLHFETFQWSLLVSGPRALDDVQATGRIASKDFAPFPQLHLNHF